MDSVVDSKSVNDCLDKIRPYIQHDGGDIELLGIDEFNVVYVSFKGACQGCMGEFCLSNHLRFYYLLHYP